MEGRLAENPGKRLLRLALKMSRLPRRGAGRRCRRALHLLFNGRTHFSSIPFVPARSGLGHQLGHVMMEENDRRVALLERLKMHAVATASIRLLREGAISTISAGGRPRNHFQSE